MGPAPDNPLYAFAPSDSPYDFRVEYGADGQLIPAGLMHGMNDLQHSSDGAWRAWKKAVTPRGGVLRLWVRYEMSGFTKDHVEAARRAVDAGLTVMVTAVGSSEQTVKNVQGVHYELDAPSDPEAWADNVADNVLTLREAGIPVTHIEIWNEPNLGDAWKGTPQSFGQFFTTVGKKLRERLGYSLKLGGPGMAGTLGDKLEWTRAIFRACKSGGFQPDFYSWHRYGSFPTEHDMLDVPEMLIREAVAAGLSPIDIILSEWNVGLPEPTEPRLDDHRAANYYLSTVMSLAKTPGTDAQFFFLQDAPWDTNQEFAGESVGVFSLAGAPKALLSGMRMMATAGDLPMVPSTRLSATSNLNLFASRRGSEGYLLAVNTFGGGMERHSTAMLRAAGVDLSTIKRHTKTVKSYVMGKTARRTVENLGFQDYVLEALDQVRAETARLAPEAKQRRRAVKIQLEDGPRQVVSVRILSPKHGNPVLDKDFLKKYQPFSKGLNQAAGQATLRQLRNEGVDETTLQRLEQGMRQKSKEIAGVPRETSRRARTLFDANYARMRDEVPEQLAEHPAAFAQAVAAKTVATLEDGILTLQLPPETAVLVEFAW